MLATVRRDALGECSRLEQTLANVASNRSVNDAGGVDRGGGRFLHLRRFNRRHDELCVRRILIDGHLF